MQVGEWKKNKPHGMGVYDYADGKKYTGQFYLGERQGQGEMKYPDGGLYVGFLLKSRMVVGQLVVFMARVSIILQMAQNMLGISSTVKRKDKD